MVHHADDFGFSRTIHVPQVQEPSDKQVKTKMLNILFEETCFGLDSSRFFDSHDAPSFFVVYAHDKPALGRADSRTVREMISYMARIKSKCRSDRSPTLSSDYSDSRARDDILENQFCLLPGGASDTSVDKVLLFYSEVLQSYCTAPEGRTYIEAIKFAGLDEINESRHHLHDEPALSPARMHSIKRRIKALVDSNWRKTWFHHVLTEIGLLSLRAACTRNPYTVIAINMHDIATISDDLGFIGPTQHYINPPPLTSLAIDEIELYHRLFFVLLERIYEDRPRIVDLIRQRYQTGITSLQEGPVVSIAVFQMTVQFEIMEDIKRFGAYVPARALDHGRKHRRRARSTSGGDTTQGQTKRTRCGGPSNPSNETHPLHQSPRNASGGCTQQQKAFLKRLDCTSRNLSRPQETLMRPMKGSLAWLDAHPTYLSWLSHNSGLLGLRGGPGTGKSTALNHLLQKSHQEDGETHIILAFFFGGGWESKSRFSDGMYSTLLYNLLSTSPQYGTDFWKWMKEHPYGELSVYDLRELFFLAIGEALKMSRVRIFIDALDEAGDDEARRIIADLRRLKSPLCGIYNGLTVCFTCRAYPTSTVDKGLEIPLRNIINDATLALHFTNTLYRHTQKETDRLSIARTLIQLLGFSRRRLSVEELRCILVSDKAFIKLMQRVEPVCSILLEDEASMTRILTTYLADLLEIVNIIDGSGEIHSVVDFGSPFVSKWVSQSDEMASVFNVSASTWIGSGHDTLARACLSLIKAEYKESGTVNTRHTTGIGSGDYAMTYWLEHAAIADREGISQAYLSDELSGEEGEGLLKAWRLAFGRDPCGSRSLPMCPCLKDLAEAYTITSLLD